MTEKSTAKKQTLQSETAANKKTAKNTGKKTDGQRYLPTTRRRKAVAMRFFTYGAMTIATIVGVVVCVGWAMGYRFDLLSGQLSQVALLQFNSFPTGAVVDVNGARLTARTPTRSNIKTGETSVQMSRQGYRSWSKTVTALPSSVRWLDYVRLVPNNVSTESVRTFSSIDDMLQTPDRKWAMLVQDEEAGTMTLVDLGDPKNPKFTDVELDKEQVTQADGDNTYELLEWDSGSRYILIAHHYGDDKVEHLEYDRQDKDTRNLTRDFGMDLADPHFSGTNGDVIFALTGTDLRKIDYGNKSLSAPIASNVTSYVLYSNSRIAFTTKVTTDDKTKQAVAIYDDGETKTIKTYDDDIDTKIGFSRNNDVDYLAVAREEAVAVYPDPLDNSSHGPDEKDKDKDVAYLSSPGGIDWMEMSNNGRFVLAGKGHKVVVYDVETTENYSFEMEIEGKPQWLDDYHLLDVRDNTITMVEFDGQNDEHIVSGDLPAFLSADNKYLFSIDTISGGTVLQRSSMTVE